MRKLLITAFEPFGGGAYNPSSALLCLLPEDAEIIKRVLPTSYRGGERALKDALEKERPDAAILTGVAGGRREISLEFCALNIKDAPIPDNDNERACGQSVSPGAPNALFTNLDLGRAAELVRGAGVPCAVSYHAGTYVCNSTYYHLLLSGTPGFFVHIPDDERSRPHEGAPFLPLSEDLRAMEILIGFLKNQT